MKNRNQPSVPQTSKLNGNHKPGAPASPVVDGPATVGEVHLIFGVAAWRAMEETGMAKKISPPSEAGFKNIGRAIIGAALETGRIKKGKP